MNTIRIWIRNLFGFSGREVNGFLVLLLLMLIAIVIVPMYRLWITSRNDDFSLEARKLDSLMAFWRLPPVDSTRQPENLFFIFDPNNASVTELEKLGFTSSLSRRIANYRQKGGKFRVKSDLLKIYGVDSSFYHQIYTYIQLPEKPLPSTPETKSTTEAKVLTKTPFDLNKADTSELKTVYGVGPVLASRIVKFRDALGGFVHTGQVGEVYGLDSVVVKRIWAAAFVSEDFIPRRLNLNAASEKELSSHPYIRKSMARAIVAYRFQHGPFQRPEDIEKIVQMKPEEVIKLLPYLTAIDISDTIN